MSDFLDRAMLPFAQMVDQLYRASEQVAIDEGLKNLDMPQESRDKLNLLEERVRWFFNTITKESIRAQVEQEEREERRNKKRGKREANQG